MIPAFVAAATAITRALGEPATYAALSPAGTISLRAVIERDIVTPIPGMEGMTLDRRTVITVRAADLTGSVPALGDTVTVGVEIWKVLAIEQDDGYLIRLKARKL
jgi:hypothetical protein